MFVVLFAVVWTVGVSKSRRRTVMFLTTSRANIPGRKPTNGVNTNPNMRRLGQ